MRVWLAMFCLTAGIVVGSKYGSPIVVTMVNRIAPPWPQYCPTPPRCRFVPEGSACWDWLEPGEIGWKDGKPIRSGEVKYGKGITTQGSGRDEKEPKND